MGGGGRLNVVALSGLLFTGITVGAIVRQRLARDGICKR
jgi:hypothetical protein